MIKKSVLIIGIAGEIGLAIAEKFARQGYDIIGGYHKSDCSKVKEICSECNSQLKLIQLDMADEDSIKNCIDEAFKVDCLSAVICNAGKSKPEILLADERTQNIDEILSINLRGTILCNKYASKHFLEQRFGSIVNISSIYGESGGACEAAYSASKAGIIGLTKALALELASVGVRVNAVAPGFIDTKMTACFNDEERNEIIKRTPLARLGQGKDVANAVYFLASEEASFITGEVINVIGGAIRF